MRESWRDSLGLGADDGSLRRSAPGRPDRQDHPAVMSCPRQIRRALAARFTLHQRGDHCLAKLISAGVWPAASLARKGVQNRARPGYKRGTLWQLCKTLPLWKKHSSAKCTVLLCKT